MNELAPFLLGGAIALLAMGVFLMFQVIGDRRRDEMDRRLGRDDPGESAVLVRRADRLKKSEKFGDRLDDGYEKMVAGTNLNADPGQLLAAGLLFGAVLAVLLYLWRGEPWMAGLGLMMGLMVPLLAVFLLQGRRRNLIQKQLPDAFYLIARSLRAGVSLEEGIRMLAKEGPKPIAEEFNRVAAAVELGLPMTTALEMEADRLNLIDFNAFVSTVSFHQSVGGNLPMLLDRLAASARDRNQFRGRFLAATAQGRFTAIGLGLAVPLFLIGYLLFQPDHVQSFLNDPRGWAVIAIAVALQLIGVVWVYNILKINY